MTCENNLSKKNKTNWQEIGLGIGGILGILGILFTKNIYFVSAIPIGLGIGTLIDMILKSNNESNYKKLTAKQKGILLGVFLGSIVLSVYLVLQ